MNITDIVNKFDIARLAIALSSVAEYVIRSDKGSENNFAVPNCLDEFFTEFGFKCIHTTAIDLELETPDKNITISCKSGQELFTTPKRRPHYSEGDREKVTKITKPLTMTNDRPGKKSPTGIPKFDLLFLYQYIPHLGFGIVPYDKIPFNIIPGGIKSIIKIDDITWVINPFDGTKHDPLPSEAIKIIQQQVDGDGIAPMIKNSVNITTSINEEVEDLKSLEWFVLKF